MNKNKKWPWGFLIIFLSGVLSYVLALTNPHFGTLEMAAILNVFAPPVATLLSLLLYWAIVAIIKERNWLLISLIFSVLNIILGYWLYTVMG